MTLLVSDRELLNYIRPTKCALRVKLRQAGVAEAESDAYEAVQDQLTEAVLAQERARLNALDLSHGTPEERLACTTNFIRAGTVASLEPFTPDSFRPLLQANAVLNGTDCTLQGSPDFLVRAESGNGYKIRLCDSSQLISDKEPAFAHARLQFYAHIYELAFTKKAQALELVDGSGKIVPVKQTDKALLESLESLVAAMLAPGEPYEPVGRSKCLVCPFHERCWRKAEESKDVALLKGVDQNMARALHEMGIKSIDALYERFGGKHLELARIERRWGKKTKAVGVEEALTILRFAQAIVTGSDLLVKKPAVPEVESYVMFDLEGVPDRLDPLAPIYLWGLQVYGKDGGDYIAAIAPFEPDGDRLGWEAFLERAQSIFARHGDIPFIHWDKYERARLDAYVERFGELREYGIAARVRKNLVDLRVEMEAALVMPIPSYSLKVVEQYIGYRRTQEEFGTNWSIQKYIEARDTADAAVRQETMAQLLKYNQEDLEAMWATLCWLQRRVRELSPG